MTSFNDREDAFEKKFVHDEEVHFKAVARRNRLLGLWAAMKLGKAPAEAEAYAKDVVMAEFDAGGDEAVFAKLRRDLTEAQASDHQIRREMDELMATATAQVKAGV